MKTGHQWLGDIIAMLCCLWIGASLIIVGPMIYELAKQEQHHEMD
jgi:hypothetical protein